MTKLLNLTLEYFFMTLPRKQLTTSDYLLIVANLVPVYGVIFLGWSAQSVFLVYCVETIIIGVFTLLRLLITGIVKKLDTWNNNGAVSQMPAWVFMLFFLLHYGLFVAVQMSLFFAVTGIGKEDGLGILGFLFKWPELLSEESLIMLASFMVSYANKQITEFILTGEYRTAPMAYLMFQPYPRIFIQQVTVLLGGIFLMFGGGVIFIIIFAVVRIFFEMYVDFDRLLQMSVNRLKRS